MEVKLLEIRDTATFIPVMCVDMNQSFSLGDPDEVIEARRYLLRRCGYPCDGKPNIGMVKLGANGDPFWNDPYAWGSRTFPVAHLYILNHWDDLRDGDVIDVEFILKETTKPKLSERVTVPL